MSKGDVLKIPVALERLREPSVATRLQKMGRSVTVVIKLMIHVRRTHVVWVVTLKAKEVAVSEKEMQHAAQVKVFAAVTIALHTNKLCCVLMRQSVPTVPIAMELMLPVLLRTLKPISPCVTTKDKFAFRENAAVQFA